MKLRAFLIAGIALPSCLLAQTPLPGTQQQGMSPDAQLAHLQNMLPAEVTPPSSGNSSDPHSDSGFGDFSPMLETEGGNAADAITPEIEDLAAQLQYDPLAIYNYCSNKIDYEHYWGSKKGAALTYLEGSGNDFDTAALMVALLRESGYSAGYRFGTVGVWDWQMASWYKLDPFDGNTSNMPFDDVGNDTAFFEKYGPYIHFEGFSDTDTPNASDYTANEIRYIRFVLNRVFFSGDRGLPFIWGSDDTDGYENGNGNGVFWYIPHVWVEVQIGDTTYELDPSYKFYAPAGSPINLGAATGYSHSSLSSALGGTTGTNYIQNINGANLAANLTTYTSNLTAWLQSNRPNDSVDSILGRQVIEPYYAVDLAYESLPDGDSLVDEPGFEYDDLVGYYFDSPYLTMQTWDAIPDEWFTSMTITVYNSAGNVSLFSDSISLPALSDQRLSLHFSGNNAYLCLDDDPWQGDTISNGTITLGSNSTIQVQININQPFGTLNPDGTLDDSSYGDSVNPPKVTYTNNSSYVYAIIHGFNVSARLVQKRREFLQNDLNNGVIDSDWQARSELLNIVGETYMEQTAQTDSLVASRFNIIPTYQDRFGRVSQEDSYYLDIYQQDTAWESFKSNLTDVGNMFAVNGLFQSALEHGILEQLQGPGTNAVSSTKILNLANTGNVAVYLANASNWAAVNSTLTSYSSGIRSSIGSFITDYNGTVLIPLSAQITSGNWSGWGYYIAGNFSDAAVITGDAAGGSNTVTGIISNSRDEQNNNSGATASTNSSQGFVLTVPTPNPVYSAEPVDLATGAYTHNRADLILGGGAPRGLIFARDYNSNRHLDNTPGLGYGWTDNLNMYVTLRSNGDSGLGRSTAYQAAPILATLAITEDLITNYSTAKDWLAAAMAADWGINQLTYKSVAITSGNQTVEYTAMPDGTYAAPPGMTDTLTLSGNAFSLSERHGNTYNFSTINNTTLVGMISNISNLYSQALTFTYDGNTGLLDKVTDCYSRNLTLNWSNGTLANVTDSSGRHVDYGYTDGNLTSVTDADGKVWTFSYDDNHNLIELKDPSSQTIVDNHYDDYNRVYEQDSQGNESQAWLFYYSDYCNTQEDPQGGMTNYFYDDLARLISVQDPTGNVDYRVYDGQNHIVQYYAPDGNLTSYAYDKDQNLVGITDPLSHNSNFTYDTSDNLTAATDFGNHTTSYTYNTKFQLLTVTDATNTTIQTNTYNSSTGDLLSITDAANKTTNFTTNDLGQVSNITYPGNVTESFTYSNIGDLLTHTDANNQTTSQTYDNRRLPLVTTLPGGNATITNVYDDEGNLQSVTVPGNHTTSYTYSPTGKLLTTTLPTVTAGTANITNHYDTRDWLVSTTDPLSHNVTYTDDAAGRVTATADQLSDTIRQAYDANGRVVSTTDAMNATTGFGYDAAGRQTSLTDALTHNIAYTYDNNANRLTLVNRLGQTYSFGYDADNRPTSLATPLGHTTNTTWNTRGLVQNITRPSGNTTAFTYDDRGRVASSNDTVGNITFGYDNNGNLLTVSQGGANITRTYDARNRVTSYTDAGNNTIGYGYDDNNNLTSLTYPGNLTVTYAYDARNELTSVTDWGNRTTSYTYDLAGRVASITWPNGASRNITYDNAGRVTGLQDWRSGSKRLALYSFTYDADGRITDEFVAPIPQAHSEANLTANFDHDNRLSAFGNLSPTYDNDGNLLTGPLVVANVSANYTYNARNELTSAGNVSSAYDALGNRISTTVGGNTTSYVVNPNAALSQVLIRTKPDTTKTYYVYGAGGVLLYQIDSSGNIETYHYDEHGNTAFLLDNSGGNITDHVEYSPFGLTANRTGTTDTPFLYCGAFGVMTDANGLLYMRARFYNPLTHTFVNADPTAFGGGMNWYAYANGDPINAMDPLGLQSQYDTGSFTEVVTGAGTGIVDWGFNQMQALSMGDPLATWEYQKLGNLAHSGMNQLAQSLGVNTRGFLYTGSDDLAQKFLNISSAFIPGVDDEDLAVQEEQNLQKLAGERGGTPGLGMCFPAGTPVLTAGGGVAIEQCHVGQRVLTSTDKDEQNSDSAVNPATWKLVKLRMPNPDGSGDVLELACLRPPEWLEANSATVGAQIHLTLQEMGIKGPAQVVAIESCPPIEAGAGRVILSTVTHLNNHLLQICLVGVAQPLAVTDTHPLFSVDRDGWVAAGSLRAGEHLKTHSGATAIAVIRPEAGTFRVYNLEVEAEHWYFAGTAQILSHNQCAAGGGAQGGVRGLGGRVLSASERAEFDGFAARARAQGLVENPNRTGSWGKIVDGKFQEVTRIDVGEAGQPGFRGQTHIHNNGEPDHLDPSTNIPGEE